MDGIITLPYSEFAVTNKLNSCLKRYDCSIYVPMSRQQKGIDLIIHKNSTKTIARIQIKSSRTYYGKDSGAEYPYYLWLNNFIGRYKKGVADFYIIFGLFAEPNTKQKITTKNKVWKEIYLCFNDNEMSSLLKSIRIKTSNKSDSFFGFGFKSSNEVYLGRGFHLVKNKDVSDNILDNKITEIIKFLNKK